MRAAAYVLPLLVLSSCTPALDRPDPSRDEHGWPLPSDSVADPLPDEPPLQPFTCTRALSSKRADGLLTVRFEPTSPTDVAFRVEYAAPRGAPAPCYRAAFRVTDGRLDDDFLSKAYRYRCRRSPHTRFAVACGPYLASDVHAVARGNGLDRTVHVRFPWTVRQRLEDPAQCALPLDPSAVHGQELLFDYADCR